MRIAIFTDSFLPMSGGVVVYVKSVATVLAEKGHKIFIFSPKSNKDFRMPKLHKNIFVIQYPGMKMFFYPDFKLTSLLTINDILKFRKLKIDLVFFQTPFSIGLKGILLAKLFKKPLIGVFHTRIDTKEYLSNVRIFSKSKKILKFARFYVYSYYNQSDLILSPSKDIKDELLKNNIKKPVIVVNNFIDDKLLYDKMCNINIMPNSFIYLGRLAVEKNLHCLIKGFKIVVRKRPDTHLYFAGKGPYTDKLREIILKSGLSNNVHLIGVIDNNIVLGTNFLKKFKAIVTMSNSEVQPLSLLEAMFKGLPIIGPDSTGIRELIMTNGILVKKNSYLDLSKAMLRILKDEKLYLKLSKNSITYSKNFTSQKIVSDLEKIFYKQIKMSPSELNTNLIL